MTDYARAPEVRDIATALIRDIEEHKNLDGIRIEYVWRDKAAKSKGRTVLASARKIGGLNAWLANASAGSPDDLANEPLFVVEVAADTWERLDDRQRRALVDHELCHLRVDLDDDGQPVLSTRGHDLEEFGCIVERHGLWKPDVARFGIVAAEQLSLDVDAVARFLDDEGTE